MIEKSLGFGSTATFVVSTENKMIENFVNRYNEVLPHIPAQAINTPNSRLLDAETNDVIAKIMEYGQSSTFNI